MCTKLAIFLTAVLFSDPFLVAQTEEPANLKAIPQLNGDAKYAFFQFSDDLNHQGMWGMIDTVNAGEKDYGILYLDKNRNLDLTESNEKFTITGDPNDPTVTIAVGDIDIREANLIHKDLVVKISKQDSRRAVGVAFRMKWNGQHVVFGGLGPRRNQRSQWSTDPRCAIIYKMAPSTSLAISPELNDAGELELRVDDESRVNIRLGIPIERSDSICSFPNNYLDVASEHLKLTLDSVDGDSEPIVAVIDQRC